MKSIISMLLMGNQLLAQTYLGSYAFVSDKTCEYYGMQRIEDPAICQDAAELLSFHKNPIVKGYNFYDRDTWTNSGRPNGCSYHKFGNVEQWHHEHEETCDVNGFAGCLCKYFKGFSWAQSVARDGIKAPMRATPRWIDVSFSDVHPFQSNARVTLSQDSDGEVVVDGVLQVRGCGGAQASFGIIVDDYYYPNEKWTKIRYTIEFVSGASSCFSLFGDTHYGDFPDFFGDNFGLTTLNVIDNQLNVGGWSGEKRLCNNEKSNFLHAVNGVGNKGFLRVEQSRDTRVYVAGISSGFSCTSVGQIVRYKDIQVMYTY